MPLAAFSHSESRAEDAKVRRVLIFLLGSLGDTLVALPALHLLARRFPAADRRALTDEVRHPKAASMAALLHGTDLIHQYYSFPGPSQERSRVRPLLKVGREIRAWKPEVIVYLHEQRGQLTALRDAVLFRALGIKRQIGVPITSRMQRAILVANSGRYEHRSEYLARSLASLGDSKLAERSSWSLNFSAAERAHAASSLESLAKCPGVVAMSIGTKIDVNDWGDDNWLGLVNDLSDRLPSWGLVAMGASVESNRSAMLMSAWHGPNLNLCGKLAIRQSGAVMERARIFIGHDSGPMHLAAAVGTPCAAIFSARHLPGLWFPYGEDHAVFYNKTDCAGCGLSVCTNFKKKCIAAISVKAVSDAVVGMLSKTPLRNNYLRVLPHGAGSRFALL